MDAVWLVCNLQHGAAVLYSVWTGAKAALLACDRQRKSERRSTLNDEDACAAIRNTGATESNERPRTVRAMPAVCCGGCTRNCICAWCMEHVLRCLRGVCATTPGVQVAYTRDHECHLVMCTHGKYNIECIARRAALSSATPRLGYGGDGGLLNTSHRTRENCT
jgi:hypothetical protein